MPDTALHPFHYSQRGRRPALWLLLAIGVLLLGLAIAIPSPSHVFLPLALYLALVVHALIRDPEHGMSITAREVRFWGPGLNRRIPVARIDHVRFTPPAQGPEAVTVHLRDGTTVDLPLQHLPTAEVLHHEFRRAGIACRER